MANISIVEEKYRIWLGTPQRMRPAKLTTRRQFAKEFEVDLETLDLWQVQPHFWDDVFAQARSVIGLEMSAVMEALLERATDGSVQAIKLCLDLLGVHSDSLELKHSFDNDQLVLVYGDKEIPTKEEES